jgi:hypothetical protein
MNESVAHRSLTIIPLNTPMTVLYSAGAAENNLRLPCLRAISGACVLNVAFAARCPPTAAIKFCAQPIGQRPVYCWK